jgi:hypothetical protein
LVTAEAFRKHLRVVRTPAASESTIPLRHRFDYVDRTTALEVVGRLRGSSGPPAPSPAAADAAPDLIRCPESFKVSCTLKRFDKGSGTSYHALSCSGCILKRNFVFDLTLSNDEYTKEGFLRHFRGCRGAQKLRHATEKRQGDPKYGQVPR